MTSIMTAKTLSIRQCGYDEYWLQKWIYDNPSCLGLGELDAIGKEHRQSSGGRLDILLKDPEDDAMYEVEVMLGDTDETHIIRTIEYWDNERRRWPQREHYAVLVAESITRRFFNVIHLLSHSIPIIAIQANIIEVGESGEKALNFIKVLNTYEERDDGASTEEIVDEKYWQQKYNAQRVIDVAKDLQATMEDIVEGTWLNFTRSYISIKYSNNKTAFYLKKRSGENVSCQFVAYASMESAEELLDKRKISYRKKRKELRFTIDKAFVANNKDLFVEIVRISGGIAAAPASAPPPEED